MHACWDLFSSARVRCGVLLEVIGKAVALYLATYVRVYRYVEVENLFPVDK